jgi:hypothetical protein
MAGVVALTAVWPMMLAPQPAAAADFTFQAVAQAPVFQITEDQPGASFHPEGDGDYNYAEADLGSQGAHALAAVVWPGAAAGHAGSLAVLLGGPSETEALNDPVKAEAGSGTGVEQSSCCPAGTGKQMSASVKPPGPTADASLSGGGLGKGMSVGDSTSHASVTMDANNLLVASASSAASGINIADVFKIGSVTSSATATSVDGAAPKLAGATVYNDMQIAGQQAYVDGTGVHIGKPGKPAGSETLGLVNQALKNFGMTIYYTDATTIRIAGTDYYYAASVLVYWHPPSNPSENVFTVSFGGAAVGVAITPGTAVNPLPDVPAAPSIPNSPAPASVSIPTDAGSSAPAVSESGPVAGANARPVASKATPIDPLAAVKTHGIPPGAIALLGLLAGAAAFAGPRLPRALSAGWKPGCELERLRQSQARSRP